MLTDVPGCTNVLEYEIKVTSNDPIKLKSYPVPYAMIDHVNSENENNVEISDNRGIKQSFFESVCHSQKERRDKSFLH